MEQNSVLKIKNIDDLQSVIRLVEEKLKETKKLVILLLESSSQNLEISSNQYLLDIKLEDDMIGQGNIDLLGEKLDVVKDETS